MQKFVTSCTITNTGVSAGLYMFDCCPNIVSRCGAKVFEAEKVATGVGPFHKSCYRCWNMSSLPWIFPFTELLILPIQTTQVCRVSSLPESKVLQRRPRWGDLLHSLLSGRAKQNMGLKASFTCWCTAAGLQQTNLCEFTLSNDTKVTLSCFNNIGSTSGTPIIINDVLWPCYFYQDTFV